MPPVVCEIRPQDLVLFNDVVREHYDLHGMNERVALLCLIDIHSALIVGIQTEVTTRYYVRGKHGGITEIHD